MQRHFTSTKQRICPKCSVAMQERRFSDEVKAHFCTKCKVLWLDHGELRALLGVRISERPSKYALKNAEHSEARCPDCGVTLWVREFPEDSGLSIEQCGQCTGSLVSSAQLTRIKEWLAQRALEARARSAHQQSERRKGGWLRRR